MFQLANRFNFYPQTIKCQVVVFLLFFPFIVFSQKVNIDSLEQILATEVDTETIVNTLIQLSKTYTHTNPEKEEKYLEQALNVAEGNEALEMKVYDKLAFNLLGRHQLDSTMVLSQKLLTYYQKTSDTEGIVYCYTLMGHVMEHHSEFEKSLEFYNKGLELSEELSLDKAALYLSIAAIQKSLGKQKEAHESCFSALEIAEKLKNNRLLGGIKDAIGSLYYAQSDYPKAIKYYKEAIEASEAANINISVASSKINLANAYLVIDNETEALKMYEEVLEFSDSINYPPLILHAKSYLAFFYAQTNSDKSEPLLADLDTLVSQLDYTGLSLYYEAKAYYYQYQEKYQLAIDFANKLRKHTREETFDKSSAYFLLAELHQKIGKYKDAYNYHVQYKMISDSVSNQEQLVEISLMEAQYNFDKEQLALEQEYQLEAVAQKRLNTLMLLFAFILGTISFFLFRVAQSRKKLSNELLKKNKDLAVLNESKTRFFTNVSHELKTPLTLIINPLEKLKRRETINKDDLYLIKTAKKNSLELLNLTNQILELTKLEVDKVDINYSNLNFAHFLKKTFANFESLAKSRGIDFQLIYQGNNDLMIKTDEYKFQTILKNLISNALKFTVPDDFVKVSAIEKEHILEIQIQDSGRGIHSEDLPHIFDRYFQSKTPKAVSEGGTGIGLAICKEYSKLLGGGISVESKYGESTTFSISLPKIIIENPINVPNAILSTIPAKKISSISHKTNSELPTLLLVEDNLEMQSYIQFTLQTHYNIIIGGNGYEGIKKLEAHSKDIQLIISDIMMPVMDGYEFLETIKKDEKFAAIPVIMLTALSDAKHKLKSLRMGIDDYLTKPFADEELIVRIDDLLVNANEKQAFQLMETSVPITSNKEVSTKEMITPIEEKISIQDLEWLKKLEEAVKNNISDSSYTVDKLAMQMATSRSLIYRKIKALTGLTPNNYINRARFEQARYYLEAKEFSSIKMIAYQVGFKDEKYFARNFKKRFGKYPSEYVE